MLNNIQGNNIKGGCRAVWEIARTTQQSDTCCCCLSYVLSRKPSTM